VGAIKKECEDDLAQALPAYNAAIKVCVCLTRSVPVFDTVRVDVPVCARGTLCLRVSRL
jgi:hypothetical protein